jgi:YD repeat-containing protein
MSGPRTVTYVNDAINRLSMEDSGVVTNYTPNGLNQYTAVSGHTAPVYDTKFNLSRYDGWTYVYDADKRLISANSAAGGGHSAQFVYDGLGRCVKRTIDGVSTVFTYDEWKTVVEWSDAGAFVAWNLYGPGPDEILVRYQPNTGRLPPLSSRRDGQCALPAQRRAQSRPGEIHLRCVRAAEDHGLEWRHAHDQPLREP